MEEALEWLAASRRLDGEVTQAGESYARSGMKDDEMLAQLKGSSAFGARGARERIVVDPRDGEHAMNVLKMMKASTAALYRKADKRGEE